MMEGLELGTVRVFLGSGVVRMRRSGMEDEGKSRRRAWSKRKHCLISQHCLGLVVLMLGRNL